ncbi:LacI family DNA-binding transcriptional regulator [Streptomyces cellulosae]
MRTVTGLREVAERAGVSMRTVSNVVRGTGRFSEATRQRVERALRRQEEHGAPQRRRPCGPDEPQREQQPRRGLRKDDGHGQLQVGADRVGERVVFGGEPGEVAQPDVGVVRAVTVPVGEREELEEAVPALGRAGVTGLVECVGVGRRHVEDEVPPCAPGPMRFFW